MARKTRAQLKARIDELEKQLRQAGKIHEGQLRSVDKDRRRTLERATRLEGESRNLDRLRKSRMVRAMEDVSEMRPGDRLIYEAPHDA